MTGMTYWITGLAGSGKSTLAQALQLALREKGRHSVLLDGDRLREVFGGDLGYSIEDRKKSAFRNARLCQLISSQGIDVICATISMFDDVRAWNRANNENYLEVYLQVPIETLRQRNQKNLYSPNSSGSVMGIDLPFEEPKAPDLILINDGRLSVQDSCIQVLNLNLTKKGSTK